MVNPTLGTLARPFGLSSLINKPVAISPDARLSSRPDNAAIVECLLSISGEDGQTIDRKDLDAWTGRLPTWFVLISNDLPRLRDASGALASPISAFLRDRWVVDPLAIVPAATLSTKPGGYGARSMAGTRSAMSLPSARTCKRPFPASPRAGPGTMRPGSPTTWVSGSARRSTPIRIWSL